MSKDKDHKEHREQIDLGAGTPEAIAFRLMEMVARDESLNRSLKVPYRTFLLKIYAECLSVVKGGSPSEPTPSAPEPTS